MRDGINRVRSLFPLLLVLLLWMLSACVPALSVKSRVEEKPVNQCDGLSYYEALRVMTVDELEQEMAIIRVSLNHVENTCDQFRLAMLLGMSEIRFNNDAEAEQIFQDLFAKEDALAIQDQQIAWMLADEIQWRKKIQSNQRVLEELLIEERSASSKLQERLTKTQSKLNQLKSIDKNINDREQEISTPSTDKIPHEPK